MLNMLKKLKTSLFGKKKKRLDYLEKKNWNKKQKTLEKLKNKNLPLLIRTHEMQEQCQKLKGKRKRKKKPWYSTV